ncbi:MAG: prepilin-type N-terminal cleavage/methylation domain-containing protein [Planctomycetes bacterium]|nr:prepilin-type N-terminal cleavage/methylation domain-containing protein [Planctomycetota bacterium]
MKCAGKKSGGFTLIELIVVITIIAMLSGVGIAFISTANKQFGFQATQGSIVSMLRSARSQAITQKEPSSVIFDLSKKEVYLLVRRNSRLWHMEDGTMGKVTGAFGNDAQFTGLIELAPEGRFGRGLAFNGAGEVDCGKLVLKGNETSLMIDLWIYPVSQTDQIILRMPVVEDESPADSKYFLMLTDDRELVAKFGDVQTTSMKGIVPLERWSRLKMVYEARLPNLYNMQWGDLKVWLNDSLVAQISGTTQAKEFNPMMLSLQDTPFYGKMDEVKISTIAATDLTKLDPPSVEITSSIAPIDNKITVTFDSKGNLSGATTATIGMAWPANRESFSITINSSGMVEAK